MSDIINILSEKVANQIAAGEVIQRPSSAIKELLENAVDAGSTYIQVIVKDVGKTLLQIIDNGCGMSANDANICIERHATSKIQKTDDLFNIRTMGFRGEALASIAAIAHVAIKTKRKEDDLGTLINIEGSKINEKEPCGCSDGTSVAVKNLFYNVPARRNFLKSNPVEMRHVIDEFQRIALAYPHIKFSLISNDAELFQLKEGTLRQRIVAVFGRNYNQRLVPVAEETSLVKISGFIGKPEYAKKTRGEQFFFVNKRFIKNGYLHHAVQNAFQDLIHNDCQPSYFLFLDSDPKSIDINIHPTKTEIKFENDRSIYAMLHAAIKQSLGKYNIAPMLDFDKETSFDIPPLSPGDSIKIPDVKLDTTYNPFDVNQSSSPLNKGMPTEKNKVNWQDLYKPEKVTQKMPEPDVLITTVEDKKPSQLHNRFIISQIKSGIIVIDQHNASERILYEKYLSSLEKNNQSIQKQLFSKTIEMTPSDFELIMEMQDEITSLGFDVREFGKNTLVLEGVPSDASMEEAEELLEKVLEQFKLNISDIRVEKRDNLARSLAKSLSIKPGVALEKKEMTVLIDELFACDMPYYSPNGYPTITTMSIEDLNKKFGR